VQMLGEGYATFGLRNMQCSMHGHGIGHCLGCSQI
jgi:hypothetical protein